MSLLQWHIAAIVFKAPATIDHVVNSRMQPQSLFIFYDGECPLCAQYIRLYRLNDSKISFVLSDLRDNPEKVTEFNTMGLNVDEGMIVSLNGEVYHGAAAVHVLALLSTKIGAFNRCNRWVFSRPRLAKIVYPVLVWCRKLLLFLLGRKKLRAGTP